MPNYLVECVIPGAGQLMPLELQSIAQQCTLALIGLDAQIQWVCSIITADSLICLYIADDESAVREHARRSGIPIQQLSEVSSIIGPTHDPPALWSNRIDGLNIAFIVLPTDSDNPI
ncbi:MAG: nickel-binding protein [Candidatus Promineifilaceae bacterium]